MATTLEIMQRAKIASKAIALLNESRKNEILSIMADALEDSTSDILSANALDAFCHRFDSVRSKDQSINHNI